MSADHERERRDDIDTDAAATTRTGDDNPYDLDSTLR